MAYYQLYYHLVWATQERRPLLTPDIEPIIQKHLRLKAHGLGGVIHALNGLEDHIHIVAAIPPKIAVAKFVGQIKATASTKFNKRHPDKPAFFWQSSYGAFSFDKKRLPYVVAYVERQKEHHAENNLIPVLERTGDDQPYTAVKDTAANYLTDYDAWFQAMIGEDHRMINQLGSPNDKSSG